MSAGDAETIREMRDEWAKVNKALQNTGEGAQQRARKDATRKALREQFIKSTDEKATLYRHWNLTVPSPPPGRSF